MTSSVQLFYISILVFIITPCNKQEVESYLGNLQIAKG